MQPFYSDAQVTFYQGDVIAVLKELPSESVHCVVTSPPYWGLRDYGADGQIGLEKTPEAYVTKMVDVFREVKRVLRKDGTCWINLGDSYASQGGPEPAQTKWQVEGASATQNAGKSRNVTTGLKPKDLIGIPWRVAFALQSDGWYLRSDIVWAKPNPMPESVNDRPTKAHEYVFLFAKSERYYYDLEAIREPFTDERNGLDGGQTRRLRNVGGRTDGYTTPYGWTNEYGNAGRNKRTVWTIPSEPYPGAHFATFPTALVEPCVKAGSSEQGVCSDCGAPWMRIAERDYNGGNLRRGETGEREAGPMARPGKDGQSHSQVRKSQMGFTSVKTTGWAPSCEHDTTPIPARVLDPFLGSGTTAYVAKELGRQAVGIDLNASYLELALKRCEQYTLWGLMPAG